ncbi:MAG: hypothetical protein IT429_00590 [Gemmataceae bacterium]|nr:hypothetical protein [Gemmataceae bacterium]
MGVRSENLTLALANRLLLTAVWLLLPFYALFSPPPAAEIALSAPASNPIDELDTICLQQPPEEENHSGPTSTVRASRRSLRRRPMSSDIPELAPHEPKRFSSIPTEACIRSVPQPHVAVTSPARDAIPLLC